jgi:hypothetical protein
VVGQPHDMVSLCDLFWVVKQEELSEHVADPHGRIESEAIWLATHEPGSRLVSFPYILQSGTRGMYERSHVGIRSQLG